MPENLAVIGVILATVTLLGTIWVYESMVRELRFQVQLRDDHIRSCQHLIASMTRHPAKGRVSPDLRLISSEDVS